MPYYSGQTGGGGAGMGFNMFAPPPTQYSNPSNTTLGQYQKTLNTAPQDYSNIMQGYQAQQGQSVFSNPQVQTGLSTLSNISNTGGYTPQQMDELRARATSPIRSIYANAQADINRQRNLQGGYSPNYTAATAKMARDQSQQISDTVGNVNAQLAQNVVGNQLAASQPLASTAGTLASGDLSRALQALGGQTQLFGTGSGMLGQLGSQVLQGQQLTDQEQLQQAQMNQLNQQNQLAELSSLIRGMA